MNNFFGSDKSGKTFIFRRGESTTIKKVFVEKRDKLSDHFARGFDRILAIRDIKNSDIQEAIEEIFKPKKDK